MNLPKETELIILKLSAQLLGKSNLDFSIEEYSFASYASENNPYQNNFLNKWKYFGRNQKKNKKAKKNPEASSSANHGDLPGSVYVGGVETLAGALIFTLGLIYPPAYGVGSALMVDGTRRVFNGLEQVDEENKKIQFPNNS